VIQHADIRHVSYLAASASHTTWQGQRAGVSVYVGGGGGGGGGVHMYMYMIGTIPRKTRGSTEKFNGQSPSGIAVARSQKKGPKN
jgi:hypothetical protein